jgi:hypothetical protein
MRVPTEHVTFAAGAADIPFSPARTNASVVSANLSTQYDSSPALSTQFQFTAQSSFEKDSAELPTLGDGVGTQISGLPSSPIQQNQSATSSTNAKSQPVSNGAVSKDTGVAGFGGSCWIHASADEVHLVYRTSGVVRHVRCVKGR